MADADENPKQKAQDQRRGRGEMGRRSTGAQASAEEANGQWDARRIVGTVSSVGKNRQQTGRVIGLWYSNGAECEGVTGENGRRRRGAALCPSGAARRQGSDLQERRTGNPVQWSHVTVAPQWTGIRGVRAIRRLGTWRQSSLRGRKVLH